MTTQRSVAEVWNEAVQCSGGYGPLGLSRAEFEARIHDQVHAVLARWIPVGAHLLEAGCGSGLASLFLAARARQVTLLDYATGSMHSAWQNTQRVRGWYPDLRVHLVQGDCERLPLRSGAFDAVFNNGVVEHWLEADQRRQVIAEMARALRPGGRVIVFVPNGRHPLMGYWRRKGYSAYFDAGTVPFHYYDVQDLRGDLEGVGLRVLDAGGLDPYSSINVWPRTRLRGLFASACRRSLPCPRILANRLGINLFAVGQPR